MKEFDKIEEKKEFLKSNNISIYIEPSDQYNELYYNFLDYFSAQTPCNIYFTKPCHKTENYIFLKKGTIYELGNLLRDYKNSKENINNKYYDFFCKNKSSSNTNTVSEKCLNVFLDSNSLEKFEKINGHSKQKFFVSTEGFDKICLSKVIEYDNYKNYVSVSNFYTTLSFKSFFENISNETYYDISPEALHLMKSFLKSFSNDIQYYYLFSKFFSYDDDILNKQFNIIEKFDFKISNYKLLYDDILNCSIPEENTVFYFSNIFNYTCLSSTISLININKKYIEKLLKIKNTNNKHIVCDDVYYGLIDDYINNYVERVNFFLRNFNYYQTKENIEIKDNFLFYLESLS